MVARQRVPISRLRHPPRPVHVQAPRFAPALFPLWRVHAWSVGEYPVLPHRRRSAQGRLEPEQTPPHPARGVATGRDRRGAQGGARDARVEVVHEGGQHPAWPLGRLFEGARRGKRPNRDTVPAPCCAQCQCASGLIASPPSSSPSPTSQSSPSSPTSPTPSLSRPRPRPSPAAKPTPTPRAPASRSSRPSRRARRSSSSRSTARSGSAPSSCAPPRAATSRSSSGRRG